MYANILRLLQLSTELYEKKKNSSRAKQLIFRYWLTASFINDKQMFYIQKAYHIAVTAYGQDTANIELYMWRIFLNIEMKNFDEAAEGLDKINSFKTYFKQNDPKIYAYIIFVNSWFDRVRDNKRGIVKNSKLLDSILAETKLPIIYVMQAGLSKQITASRDYFLQALEHNVSSPFLYVELYKFLVSVNSETPGIEKLLLTFVNWAIVHEVDVKKLIIQFNSALSRLNYYGKDEALISYIYEVNPVSWALEKLVNANIANNNKSIAALQQYLKAKEQQLNIRNIDYFIISSAYENDYEKIPLDLVEKELSSTGYLEYEKSFMYHVIIIASNSKITRLQTKGIELTSALDKDILDFGAISFANYKTGKYYNTIYTYILETFRYDAKLCKTIHEQLFTIEVTIPEKYKSMGTKYVWVQEQEKKDMSMYDVTGGKAYIKAVSDNFRLFFMGEKQKTLISVNEPIIKKQYVDLSELVLKKLFQKGNVDINILLSLATIYTSKSYLQKDNVDVLLQVIKRSEISNLMRIKISKTLGKYYEKEHQPEKAYSFFKSIEDKYMDNDVIQEMLKIFINMSETKKALSLLIKKRSLLPDKTLFYAVKQIIKKEEYKSICAEFAYDLLLKTWYDKELADTVMGYYKGSISKWAELLDTLTKLGVDLDQCTDMILNNALLNGKFNESVQKIFIQYYERKPDNKWIDKIIYFIAARKMTETANFEVSIETIKTLEKIYETREEPKLLTYALACSYISQPVETINTEKFIRHAVQYMEEESVLIPLVKKYQDKTFISSYIEKNFPFVYKAIPGKNIFVNYKLSTDEIFIRRQMKYYRFGLYTWSMPIFYGEEIQYYFEEDGIFGTIKTYQHQRQRIVDQYNEAYFDINNALIYSKMYKYENVENIIGNKIKDMEELTVNIL